MQRTLYSGHLSIVAIIFSSQPKLPPRTNLSIADTSNIRHFLKEICIHFTLDNVLQFCLSSLRSLLFYFLGSLMAFSGPWKCMDYKFVGISSPYSSLWLTYFPVAKMSKAQWDRDRTMDTIMEFLSNKDNRFPFTVRIRTNHRNSVLVNFVDWLFHLLQTLANQLLPNYHINMIYWYIWYTDIYDTCYLYRLFLLPTPTFRHTLGSITL